MSKAMEERIDRERIEVLYASIKSLMHNMKLSSEQAMEALNVSQEDKEVLRKNFDIINTTERRLLRRKQPSFYVMSRRGKYLYPL